MKTLLRILTDLYGWMVRCYPSSIRVEFGEEMRAVFRKASVDALVISRRRALVVFLAELLDWPFELLGGYLDVISRWSRIPTRDHQAKFIFGSSAFERKITMISQERSLNMSKRQVMIAALPPLLLGLGIMLSAMIRTDVWYRLPSWQLYLSVFVVMLPGIVIGLGGLVAVIKHIPDWGLSWVGCAFMGVTLFAMVFVEEGVEEGWLSLSPTIELVIGLTLFLTGFILLILMAKRGWYRAGLFTLAVASTMGLSLFQSLTAAPFNRDDIALFAGPLGLIIAMLIYIYILNPGMIRIVMIAGVGVINTGAALIATNAWRSSFENRGAASPLLPLLVILTGLLLSGPISGLLVSPLRRLRSGR